MMLLTCWRWRERIEENVSRKNPFQPCIFSRLFNAHLELNQRGLDY